MFRGKQADELSSTLTPRPMLYKRYGGQSTPETEGMSSQENSGIKTKHRKTKTLLPRYRKTEGKFSQQTDSIKSVVRRTRVGKDRK